MKIGKYKVVATNKIISTQTFDGIPLEDKIRKWLQNGDTIEADCPMLYLNKSDGVKPETDIRTDRFDIAIDTTTNYSRKRVELMNKNPDDAA